MGDAKANVVDVAKDGGGQAAPKDASGLSDLLRAHIRLIAVQRNLNALALQHRDLQQEAAKAEAEFHALRKRVEEQTGLVYNDQTLVLERNSR